MILKLLAFIAFSAYSLDAYSSAGSEPPTKKLKLSEINRTENPEEFEDLAEDLLVNIFSYLEPKNIGSVGLTDRKFMNLLSRSNLKGKGLREQSKFGIRNSDNSWLFLEEILEGERQSISKIRNIVPLLKERPNDFIKLVLKSVPHTPETIESDLHSFYHDTFQVEKLIQSLPFPGTSQQRLANILIELLIWSQFEAQVEDLVENQVWAQVDNLVWGQLWARVANKVGDRVNAQVGIQIRNQIENQVGNQIQTQISTQFGNQSENQFRAQLNEDLQGFQFATSHQGEDLDKVLKTAIDYTFIVFQLGTLAVRYSEVFKPLDSKISQFIAGIITEEQASTILSNLEIPDAPEGNYLVETQLKLIKRLIPSES